MMGEEHSYREHNTKPLTEKDLTYAAYERCPCGAGLAYVKASGAYGDWDCADILLGRASKDVKHTERLPFVFYSIKSERQPSADGATTRPSHDEGEEKHR
jgi:hypothetical protein